MLASNGPRKPNDELEGELTPGMLERELGMPKGEELAVPAARVETSPSAGLAV